MQDYPSPKRGPSPSLSTRALYADMLAAKKAGVGEIRFKRPPQSTREAWSMRCARVAKKLGLAVSVRYDRIDRECGTLHLAPLDENGRRVAGE